MILLKQYKKPNAMCVPKRLRSLWIFGSSEAWVALKNKMTGNEQGPSLWDYWHSGDMYTTAQDKPLLVSSFYFISIICPLVKVVMRCKPNIQFRQSDSLLCISFSRENLIYFKYKPEELSVSSTWLDNRITTQVTSSFPCNNMCIFRSSTVFITFPFENCLFPLCWHILYFFPLLLAKVVTDIF